jgi:excisionase family DNA binding protein
MSTLAPIAVSPADACAIANVGPTKLYQALHSGALPAVKLGRKTLVKIVDLTAWIESFAALQTERGGFSQARPRGAPVEECRAAQPAGRDHHQDFQSNRGCGAVRGDLNEVRDGVSRPPSRRKF